MQIAERRLRDPDVNAHFRFGRYKTEEAQQVRKLDAKKDETLEKIKKAFVSFDYKYVHASFDWYEGLRKAVQVINEVIRGYTAGDVERFSVALAEFADEKDFAQKAGLFLSALINNCRDSDFVIHTSQLPELWFLGFANTKNIIIEGDGGDWLAFDMVSDKIIVNGNSRGNLGVGMKSGELHFNGEQHEWNWTTWKGVRIFHNGKLIHDTSKKGFVLYANGQMVEE